MPFSVYEIIIKNANKSTVELWVLQQQKKHLCYLFMIFKYNVIICIHVYVIYFIKIFLFCTHCLHFFITLYISLSSPYSDEHDIAISSLTISTRAMHVRVVFYCILCKYCIVLLQIIHLILLQSIVRNN